MSHLAKSLINNDGKIQTLRKARDFLIFRKSMFYFLYSSIIAEFFYLRTLNCQGDQKMYKSERNEWDSLVFFIRNEIMMDGSQWKGVYFVLSRLVNFNA